MSTSNDSPQQPRPDGVDAAGGPGRNPHEPLLDRRSPPNAVALLGLGLANACCVVLGLLVGWFVDRELGTAPVFVLVGLASGIVLGIIGTFTQVRRFLRE